MEKKKIFVGLSGGVDSAVSAALLVREGHDVTGVFIKIWQPEFLECTWREDRLDAMRVAAHLKIPFLEIDLSEEYKNEVVQDMITAYAGGKTPNPDVLCNERIKFGHFLRFATDSGADYVATGHYARIETVDGTPVLSRGLDEHKDQSYFLARLGADELSKALFPVGSFRKDEVRTLAREFNLPVSSKPDSQGLCFVGAVSIPEFLSRYITLSQGDVRDEHGAVIGSHDGAALFTVGQRHGFRTDSRDALYVTGINTQTNTITVSSNTEHAARLSADVSDIRWTIPSEGKTLSVQTRYREEPVAGVVQGAEVVFSRPHVASPGQTAAFYDGPLCVGCALLA